MALSKFLTESKQQYLDAVKEGKGREWIVVMGNEAGDLDSVASSVAYAWFASTVQKTPAVALLQTQRGDLNLRPENTHAFVLAEISSSHDELLCIDDIPQSHSISPSFPSNRFALVDHNRLLPQFETQNDHVEVIAVLDHHDDEGMYRGSAEPRIIIVPTGSASSIVARHIEEHSADARITKEIARLLLCAILVDTAGLRPGGKAEVLDRAAAAYLLAHAELGTSSGPSAGGSSLIDEASIISTLANELLEKKSDVARLGTTDLLRRDYKQYAYAYTGASNTGGPNGRETVHVGLSTVPVDLCVWLARGTMENFWREVDGFMDARGLDVLGVLTTFVKEKHKKKHGKKPGKKHGDEDADESEKEKKGKHKRQILLVVRDAPVSSSKNRGLEARLLGGLEGAPELALEERSLVKFARKHHRKDNDNTGTVPDDAGVGDRKVKVYKQGNAKATRKVVAPLLKKIIEGDTNGDGVTTA